MDNRRFRIRVGNDLRRNVDDLHGTASRRSPCNAPDCGSTRTRLLGDYPAYRPSGRP